MYCGACGKESSEDDQFCIHCGKKLRHVAAAKAAAASPSYDPLFGYSLPAPSHTRIQPGKSQPTDSYASYDPIFGYHIPAPAAPALESSKPSLAL